MATQLEIPEDDAISLTLSKFEPEYLLNVLQGLKHVIDMDPQQGRSMLEASQDLTYAVLQAELLMGLVDESVVMEAMKAAQVSLGQDDVQSKVDAPAPVAASANAPAAAPTAAAPAPSPAVPAAEPSPEPTKTEPKDPLAGLDPQQAEMIRQVILIPEDQLALLPPEQQEQVRNLKRQYSS